MLLPIPIAKTIVYLKELNVVTELLLVKVGTVTQKLEEIHWQ